MGAYISANFRVWLRGIVAAFIGGGSSAVSGAVALNINDPSDFNTGHPAKLLNVMMWMFLISGLMAAFAYLKQSPIPAEGPADQVKAAGV